MEDATLERLLVQLFLDISVTLILLFALNYFSIAAFIVRTVLLILLFYFVGLRRGLA